MTQITQHQIDDGIRQAHLERAEAMASGLRFIRSAIARGMTKIAEAAQTSTHATRHTQH